MSRHGKQVRRVMDGKTPQGGHLNKYADLVRPNRFSLDSDLDGDCDYFKINVSHSKVVYANSTNNQSSIECLSYNPHYKNYVLRLRGFGQQIYKDSIDAFFDLVSIGELEKKEIKVIKKLITPYLDKK